MLSLSNEFIATGVAPLDERDATYVTSWRFSYYVYHHSARMLNIQLECLI